MSFEDLQTFTLAFPCYKFSFEGHIFQTCQKMKIDPTRIITTSSSDIRFARNVILHEFLKAEKSFSDLLIMCDLDTTLTVGDLEALVLTSSDKYPILGTNMCYRGSQGTATNWFLEDDIKGLLKETVKNNYEMKTSVLEVGYMGFGLVAIRRKVIEELTEKYGTAQMGGLKNVPVLFNEERLQTEKLKFEVAKHGFKEKYREFCKQENYEEFWNRTLEPLIKNRYNNEITDNAVVFPESYSFCQKARKAGFKIHVHLGIRPGHLEEVISYSKFPILEPSEENEEPIYVNRYSSDLVNYA